MVRYVCARPVDAPMLCRYVLFISIHYPEPPWADSPTTGGCVSSQRSRRHYRCRRSPRTHDAKSRGPFPFPLGCQFSWSPALLPHTLYRRFLAVWKNRVNEAHLSQCCASVTLMSLDSFLLLSAYKSARSGSSAASLTHMHSLARALLGFSFSRQVTTASWQIESSLCSFLPSPF